MMDDVQDTGQVRTCAEMIRRAADTGIATDATPSDGLTLDQAYEVCMLSNAQATDAGRRAAGYKIGLTSPGAQATFAAREPTWGQVLADTVVHHGETLSIATMIAPAVEVEVAFVIDTDVTDPAASAATVLAATGSIAPALEIVDSRWIGGPKNLPMLIADNTNAAAAVLGETVEPPQSVADLTSTLALGDLTVPGSAEAVMGDPAEAVAWLARRLLRSGRRLAAGDVVLSGTLCPPTPVGETTGARAEIVGLGSVSVNFDRG